MSRRPALFLPLVLACLGAAGVAAYRGRPTTATVVGRVTLDGVPVPAGSVMVAGDRPRWGTIAYLRPDGTFELADVPPGWVSVGVRTRRVRTGGPADRREPVRVPERYEDPATSGLRLELTAGVQAVELPLTGGEE